MVAGCSQPQNALWAMETNVLLHVACGVIAACTKGSTGELLQMIVGEEQKAGRERWEILRVIQKAPVREQSEVRILDVANTRIVCENS